MARSCVTLMRCCCLALAAASSLRCTVGMSGMSGMSGMPGMLDVLAKGRFDERMAEQREADGAPAYYAAAVLGYLNPAWGRSMGGCTTQHVLALVDVCGANPTHDELLLMGMYRHQCTLHRLGRAVVGGPCPLPRQGRYDDEGSSGDASGGDASGGDDSCNGLCRAARACTQGVPDDLVTSAVMDAKFDCAWFADRHRGVRQAEMARVLDALHAQASDLLAATATAASSVTDQLHGASGEVRELREHVSATGERLQDVIDSVEARRRIEHATVEHLDRTVARIEERLETVAQHVETVRHPFDAAVRSLSSGWRIVRRAVTVHHPVAAAVILLEDAWRGGLGTVLSALGLGGVLLAAVLGLAWGGGGVARLVLRWVEHLYLMVLVYRLPAAEAEDQDVPVIEAAPAPEAQDDAQDEAAPAPAPVTLRRSTPRRPAHR
jgi:hypothetical protein